jgi:hypothetical protein
MGQDRKKMAMLIIGKKPKSDEYKSEKSEMSDEMEYSHEDAMMEVAEMMLKAIEEKDAKMLAEAMCEMHEVHEMKSEQD